jgi:hypothetical protein
VAGSHFGFDFGFELQIEMGAVVDGHLALALPHRGGNGVEQG